MVSLLTFANRMLWNAVLVIWILYLEPAPHPVCNLCTFRCVFSYVSVCLPMSLLQTLFPLHLFFCLPLCAPMCLITCVHCVLPVCCRPCASSVSLPMCPLCSPLLCAPPVCPLAGRAFSSAASPLLLCDCCCGLCLHGAPAWFAVVYFLGSKMPVIVRAH